MEAAVHTKADVLERLQRLGPELRALGVARLGLFGSFVRGRPRKGSDVDLLVEFTPGRKSFDRLMQVAARLEEVLQRPVEVLTRESLSPYIGPRILEETEYVSFSD